MFGSFMIHPQGVLNYVQHSLRMERRDPKHVGVFNCLLKHWYGVDFNLRVLYSWVHSSANKSNGSFICTDLVVQGCAPKVASMDLCEELIVLRGFRRNKTK